MTKEHLARRSGGKSAILKVRCTPALKDQINLAAKIKELDAADIVRIACSDYTRNLIPR